MTKTAAHVIKIEHPVGDWIFSEKVKNAPVVQNKKPDVALVQQLLLSCSTFTKNPNYRPKNLNGVIARKGSSTVKAIKSFQLEVLERKSPQGVIFPTGKTFFALEAISKSYGFSKLEGVNPKLKRKIFTFIARFGSIGINSGKRSRKKQAELMARQTDAQLVGWYGDHPYIQEIIALPRVNGQRDLAKVEAALNKGLDIEKRGVSRHLSGKAVDIAAPATFDMKKAKKLATQLGLKFKDETVDSNPCFHVSID